jgi:hypothetical protein
MAERRNGGILEGGIGRTIDSGRTAERQKGYIPNLPDIFTVHAGDDDNVDEDDDDDDTDTL